MSEELILIPENISKSRSISIIAILTALMLAVNGLIAFIPVPVDVFLLYIFKEFKKLTEKAYLIATVMTYLALLIYFGFLMLILILMDLCVSGLILGIFRYDKYLFSNRAIFMMGIAVSFWSIPITFGLLTTIPHLKMLLDIMTWVQRIIVTGALITIGFLGSGIAMRGGFKFVKDGLNRMVDLDKLVIQQ